MQLQLLYGRLYNMANMIINNMSHVGKSITIIGDKVIIDGKDVTPDSKSINITINGNIDIMNVDRCSKIEVLTGNVGSISTVSGNIVCCNVGGAISSVSGDVECENVTGNIKTTSGDVKCGAVSGSVSTMSGDIRNKK